MTSFLDRFQEPQAPLTPSSPTRAPTGGSFLDKFSAPTSQVPQAVSNPRPMVPQEEEDETSALLFAAGLGIKDTYRGVKQLIGVDTADMKADDERLKRIFANPEYGKKAQAAWIGGMVVDPAGWLIPMGKARTVGKLALYGAGFGGLSGFLGYVDDQAEEWKNRLINAGIGAGAGAVLVPAVSKGVEGITNQIGKLKGAQKPLQGMAPGSTLDEVSELIEQPMNLETMIQQVQGKRTLMQPVKQFYQNTVGAPIKKFVWNNAGSLALATTGAVTLNEVLKDTELSETSRVGATLAGFTTLALTGKLTAKTDMGQWMARQVIDNYGLTKDYVTLKKSMMTDQNNVAAKFMDIAEKMKELEPSQRNALYNILNGSAASTPDELAGIASESRNLLKDIGQRMVDYGLVDERVYKKNLDTYLNRSYEQHLAGKTELSRLSEVFVRKIRVIGTELRPRGIIKEVSAANEDKWVQQGYEVFGEGRKKGTIKVRRQLTETERKAMGEIEDAAFAMVRTGRLMSNDISRYKFYDDVSKNFAVDLPEGGNPNVYLSAMGTGSAQTILGANPALQSVLQKGEKLVKLEGGKIKGTDTYQYGNLEGKWIPDSIYKDIKWMERYSKTINTPFIKGYRDLQQYWKIGKTAWNPAVHMNNIVSNVAMYDLAEGSYKNLSWATKELIKGPEKSPFVREAIKNGVFDADMFTQELNAANRNFLKDYLQAKGNDQDEYLLNAIKSVKNLSGRNKGWLPADLYAFEDKIFRLGLYRTRIERGFSPDEAVKDARRWFIDYDVNAPMINLLRETITPFIAYSYRVIPLLAESAIMKPWKFAKWAALGYGLSYMGEDIVESEDQDKERRMFDKWNQGNIFGVPGMPPKMLKMPLTVDGIPQYLNVERWIPGGDVFEAKSADNPLPTFLAPSGVGMALFSGLIGFDSFKGGEIEGLLDGETINNIKVKAEYIFNQMIPNLPAPFVLSTHASKKLEESIRGAEPAWKEPLPVWQAALQLSGIKVTPFDIKKAEARAAVEYLGKMNEIRDEVILKAVKRHSQNMISEEQLKSEIQRASQLIRETTNKFQKRQTGVDPRDTPKGTPKGYAEGGTVEETLEDPPKGMRLNPMDGPKWIPIEKEPGILSRRVREYLKTPEDKDKRPDLVPLRRNEKGDLEPAMPNMVREGLQSLWNVVEGTKTGDLSPKDALVLSGTSGVASRIGPRGTLGMFAGERANTASVDKRITAKSMEAEGKDPELARKETGWFRGADQNWKFEIDDYESGIVLREFLESNGLKDLSETDFVLLKDVFDHPELFKAYPEIANIKVKEIDRFAKMRGALGYYNPNENVIGINTSFYKTSKNIPEEEEKLRSTLLHELQHYIQTAEGFARGGNRREFFNETSKTQAAKSENYRKFGIGGKEYNELDKHVKEEYKGIFFGDGIASISSAFDKFLNNQPLVLRGNASRTPEEKIEAELSVLNKMREDPKLQEYFKYKSLMYQIGEKEKEARDKYQRLSGEVEARNVEERRDFTGADRKTVPPKDSQDTPNDKQIMKYKHGGFIKKKKKGKTQ